MVGGGRVIYIYIYIYNAFKRHALLYMRLPIQLIQ